MSKPNVWVTGGSSGIGAHLADHLVRQGYQVVSIARRKAAGSHDSLVSLKADLSDPVATRSAFQQAAEQWPSSRIIHNAGAIIEKPVEEVVNEDLTALSQLHLGCAISMLQAALPRMRCERHGRVVLMSTRAVVGLEKRTVYSATKAGMIGMARTWALELAEHGVTVNVVAPGAIEDTEMFHDVVEKGSELEARVAERIPVGRIGRPSDVARAVDFFLSDDAGFVTGQTLFVCGGSSVGNMSFT